MIELKVPVLGESIVEASIARWAKKVGDLVREDELIVEIETDKVTLEVTAPHAGQLNSILFDQGATVRISDIIALIDEGVLVSLQASAAPVGASSQNTEEKLVDNPVQKTAETLAQASAPVSVVSPTSLGGPSDAPVFNSVLFDQASPSVRKRIAEGSLDPRQLQSSRLDGRLLKEDLLAGSSAGSGGLTSAVVAQDRAENRVSMSRLRQRIAERLKDAQNTAAMLTTFNEIDMTAVKFLRDRYKESFEKQYGVKLGFMSFFMKACVKALQDVPVINSRIDGADIVSCNYCDIGVAVSAPNGLMVPIIRDADLMDLHDMERAIADYGQKAKNNKLSIDDMSGGTFTISNGGIFGSLLSTPIINPPQSAILGMHKIQDRPVAINGRVEIRPMMYVALSYDHRLVDGREAVTFLVSIKESIENPGRFLLGL